MPTATAPGKIILFGEHFVLYGAPAVAASLDIHLTALVTPSDQDRWQTSDLLTTIEQYNNNQLFSSLKKALGCSDCFFQIKVTSNLPRQANLGSGAALCVALTRALAALTDKLLTDEEVIRIATEAEHHLHGRSSGMDTSVVTLGGVIKVESAAGQLRYERITTDRPFHLVVALSHTASPTKQMIERVREYSESEPKLFEQILESYSELAKAGEAAFKKGEFNVLGGVFNEVHALLCTLGLSTDELDTLSSAAKSAGALGAKLTGGGGGGTMIALCAEEESQQQIAKQLTKAGAKRVLTTTIGSV